MNSLCMMYVCIENANLIFRNSTEKVDEKCASVTPTLGNDKLATPTCLYRLRVIFPIRRIRRTGFHIHQRPAGILQCGPVLDWIL